MWVDSHCHLDSLEGDIDTALARAAEAGVSAMVTIGTDLESSRRALELARSHPQVWAAAGVHPHDADDFDDASGRTIEALASEKEAVAVGEVGLDFFRNLSRREAQERAFEAQIAIAKRLEKPLVLHVRDAYEEVFSLLQKVGPPQLLIFHCFSGDARQAAVALDLGGFISFAGNVSFKNAESLRGAAREVPLDRLLVETDSPYLAPVPYRGKPNEPAYVVHVGKAIAEAVGKPVEAIAEVTSENAARVFSLPLEA